MITSIRARRAPAMLSVLVLAAALVSGCSSDSDGSSASADSGCKPLHPGLKTMKKGVLTVGASPGMPYDDVEGDTLVGIDGKIAAAFAKAECLDLKITQYAGAAILPAVQAKRADIGVAGFYVTPERQKVVGMTTPEWYDFAVVVSKDGEIKTVDDLKGKDIGVTAGSEFVDPLTKLIGADHVKIHQLADGTFQDVQNGRTPGALMGAAEAGYRISQLGDSDLKTAKMPADPAFSPSEATANAVTIIYQKDATEFGAALDEAITKFREDGTVRKILDGYGLTEDSSLTGK